MYRAQIGDQDYALKWYRKEYVHADRRLWERLKRQAEESLSLEMPWARYAEREIANDLILRSQRGFSNKK